jgi:hypothetical protein
MNNIDRMYTSDAVEFARSYLEYLQVVLRRIDPAEIGQFIRTCSTRANDRRRFSSSAMVAARQLPVILPTTCRSALSNTTNHFEHSA